VSTKNALFLSATNAWMRQQRATEFSHPQFPDNGIRSDEPVHPSPEIDHCSLDNPKPFILKAAVDYSCKRKAKIVPK
jgi:hypothetical protein